MKRWVFAWVLFLAGCFGPETAFAKMDPEISLGDIVVSSRRSETPSEHVPGSVTVVDEETIGELPAGDPAELLRYVPGVDSDPGTKFGHFRPLSIQGSESRHVLVMVDGIPFNTQLSGQADIFSALPLQGIGRLEVLRGSSSSVWGSSLGGVMNVVTKDIGGLAAPRRVLSTRFAEHRTQQQDFEWSGQVQNIGYYAAGSYFDTGGQRPDQGVPDREDTMQKKFFGKLRVPLTDILSADASYGYSGVDLHEGVYPSSPTRTEMPYYARYGQLRFEAIPDETHEIEAAFKVNRQLIQSGTFFLDTDTLLSSVRSTDHYYGVALKDHVRLGRYGDLTAGYDVSTHVLKTTLMAQSRDIWLHAPYANYELTLEPVTWTVAARYDDNEEFGRQFSPSAGAVLELPFWKKTLVRANASKGFNAPPLLWKYFEDSSPGVTANNPNLRAERARTYEAGIESTALPGAWLKFGVYRSEVRDAVATVMNAQGLFIKQNFDEFRQQGVELDSKFRLSDRLDAVFAANFNDVENTATGETVRGRGVTRPSFRLGLDFDHPCGFKAGVWGNYSRWDSLPSSEPNDRKFIFDAKIAYVFRKFLGVERATLSLSVFNLANSKYWSDINLPSPQRYFEGGLSFEF